MNLFDFTYCGDYNRQIVNLAGIVPERWSYSGTEDIWSIHLNDFMRKEKSGKRKNLQSLIQDSLIIIISQSMLFLFPIWFRTGRDGFWTAFIRIII